MPSSTVYIGLRVTRTHGIWIVAVNFADYYGRSLRIYSHDLELAD
jgi:hypothetical protein